MAESEMLNNIKKQKSFNFLSWTILRAVGDCNKKKRAHHFSFQIHLFLSPQRMHKKICYMFLELPNSKVAAQHTVLI